MARRSTRPKRVVSNRMAKVVEIAMPRIALHIARSVALAGLAGGVCLMNSPNGSILISPVAAQEVVSVSVEFHIALEPFGAWHLHAGFAEPWGQAYPPAGCPPSTVC